MRRLFDIYRLEDSKTRHVLGDLYSQEDSDTGTVERITTGQKSILCSICGREAMVSGETIDFICPKCITIEEFNYDIMFSDNWNMKRFDTLRKQKLSTLTPAIGIRPQRQRTVLDVRG